MQKLTNAILSLLLFLLAACSDDPYTPTAPSDGHAMRFEVTVIDQPQTRGHVTDVYDNEVTRDFKPGDSFGLFIIDSNDQFVTHIDGKNALNIRLTTPDGKAWNLASDITEVVHKLGYRYIAYYPYAKTFDSCHSPTDIQARLTAPPTDQSTQAATDWLYTEITSPQTNAVTTLAFRHRYAKIEIHHSFTQDHSGEWTEAYKYTKTIDDNGIEHYRYIIDATTPTLMSVSGTYTIGNSLTGIKQFAYNCDRIAIENGRHSIIYTYRMDERCAVDLGLPSGIKWSPINLGTETDTYMDQAAIAQAATHLGKRLAWGELFEKDTYSYATYIDDPYQDNKSSLLPSDISGTVYDPVRQYWGGHWTLPSADDLREFIDNTDLISTETISDSPLGEDILKLTFRSKLNGNEITMLTNGYANNTTISYPRRLYYMSANRNGYAYNTTLHYNNNMSTTSLNRYQGINIRPVLKELHVYTDSEKQDIVVRHIDDLAVDFGITKTVTETLNGVSYQVTYKLLWSPFNYGAEAKTAIQTYNHKSIDETAYLSQCTNSTGIRIAWGYLQETETFYKDDYFASDVYKKDIYKKYNTTADKDFRDLQPEDDIVQVNWPEGWCIPTAKDLELLCQYTDTDPNTTTVNGTTYVKLNGKGAYAGASILVPLTGYKDDNKIGGGGSAFLQSRTIGTAGSQYNPIFALQLNSTSRSLLSTAGRRTGLMVRPVKYEKVGRTPLN